MFVQEVFPQTAVDTVEKLDKLIRGRKALLHLIGAMPGAVANEKAVAAYLKAVPDLLQNQPDLKASLGDFSGITYTQWEAYIALHHEVPLFIYATDAGLTSQAEHLNRLRLARKYPGEKRITDPADLFGQLIGDLREILSPVPSRREFDIDRGKFGNIPPGLEVLTRQDEIAAEAADLLEATRKNRFVCRVKHGLGGVGKTRHCIEVANLYRAGGEPAFFITGIDEEGTDDWLKALAKDLPLLPNGKLREGHAAVVDWLKGNQGWLLVVDGVDCRAVRDKILKLREVADRGHLLISSRLATGWPSSFTTRRIANLTQAQTVDFLQRLILDMRPFDANGNSLRKLAKLSGGLALAISQAAAYLNQHPLEDLSDYEVKLETLDPEIIQFLGEGEPDASAPLSRIWLTSFRRLKPFSRTLLRLLAHLDEAPIPLQVIKSDRVQEIFSIACLSDPYEEKKDRRGGDLEAAFTNLAEYSLITRDEVDSFRVHRLVIGVTLSSVRHSVTMKKWEALIGFVGEILKEGSEGAEVGRGSFEKSYPRKLLFHVIDLLAEYLAQHGDESWANIYPHVFSVLTITDSLLGSLERAASLPLSTRSMLFLAEAAQARGQGSDTRAALAIAKSILRRPGEDSLTKLKAQGMVADLTFELGKVAESVELATRFIAERPRTTKANSFRIAWIYSVRSWSYRTLGRSREAVADGRKAIALSTRYEDSGILNGNLLVTLAGACDYAGLADEALDLYQRAVEAAVRENDVSTEATNLYLLGWFQLRNGDPESALLHCQRSIQLGRDYGFEGPLAEASIVLAVREATLGNFEAALVHIKEAEGHEYDLIHPWIGSLKGAFLIRCGRITEAASVLQSLVRWIEDRFRTEPEDYDSLQMLSLALVGIQLCKGKRDFSSARSVFEKSKSLSSDPGIIAMFKGFFFAHLDDRCVSNLWHEVYGSL
jgi:tetratricopeptide (TPR) repeat protein